MHVHQRHLIQLQNKPWTAHFQLPFHFRKILRLNSTDQSDGRAALADNLFDLQGHDRTSWLNAMSGPFVTACKNGRLGAG
jgi:hypothetical protein